MSELWYEPGPPDTARVRSAGWFFWLARGAPGGRGLIMAFEVHVDPEELLTGPEIARLVELAPATWRSYVRKGLVPAADDPGVGPINRRTPRWKLSTVREWRLNRPGQGARTDLGREAS